MGHRTASGDMLGSPTKRYIPNGNIPYRDPSVPVNVRAPKALPAAVAAQQSGSVEALIASCGAENPVVELTEEWSVCYDESAAALYYYSSVTGEATWIKPNLAGNKHN